MSIKNMTIEEKTRKVKEDMAKGKFSSIEDACKHYKFAPASYYNYSKKMAVTLPQTPTTAQNWSHEIETLRRENEELKKRLESDRMKIFKLERKIVSFVIGEVQV